MQKQQKIFGENLEMTASAAVHLLESTISEGILTPTGWEAQSVDHTFGRTPNRFTSNDLSFLLGIASSGLRTAGFLHGEDLVKNIGQLCALTRQHIGAVVHVISKPAGDLSSTGCFQLVASTAQEAVDFALIAHRVAELSLVPGIVQVACGNDQESVQFPKQQTIRQFLGDPDEQIACPTPAQKMLFGDTRRRLPNWFNFDFPTVNGVEKDAHAQSLEAAARQRFFYKHLPEIFASVFAEFEKLTGRKYAPVSTHRTEDADYVLVTQGAVFQTAVETVDELRSNEKAKVGCLKLNLLHPFPSGELAKLLSGKKAVTVLEAVDGMLMDEPPVFTKVKAALEGVSVGGHLWDKKKETVLCSASIGLREEGHNLKVVLQNMLLGEKAKRHFYLGLHFTKNKTDYPQHEVLLQTIERDYPGIGDETLPEAPLSTHGFNRGKSDLGLPLVVRKHKNLGPPYSRLSRFYQDTAYFFKSGEAQELVADPFQALPVMPATTAGLSGMDARRTELPVFSPEKCTGCGACFVQCPHSAIPPVALGFESLLRGGMDIAGRKGLSVSALTPLVKNLGKVSAQTARQSEIPVTKVADFLPFAFEKLTTQLNLSGEKLENAQRDFNNLLSVLSDFPVAVTEEFFEKNETCEKGSGELFSLAIDPHACTACGLCAQICPEDALTMTAQTPELLAQTEHNFSIWEQLPDTASDTIRRQVNDGDYNPFAAVLLSRFNYLSMTGGSLSESGAPAKTLLHWLTALTESAVQPGVVEQAREVEKLIENLSENIHEKLSGALPKEDSSALWNAIAESKGKRLPMDEIFGKLGSGEHLKLLDTAILQRKIQLVNDLKELRWLLTEGPNGMGRSRFGLALHDGSLPGATFPFNPFTTPVIFDKNGVTAELAEGLFQGYLRHALDNLRLLRRARLEASDKYQPDVHAPKIAALRWQDLEEGEKRLVPPMLLVGNRDSFLDKNFIQLNSLLAGDFPIKIIVLNDGQLSSHGDAAVNFSKNNTLLLSAMALRKAFVFQGVMDGGRVLFNNLLKGLQRPGPAFFHLLAPDHGQHRSLDWTALPKLALETRAFPFFRFDPAAMGDFLSTQTSLEGNPSADENWHIAELNFTEGEVEKSQSYTLTLADWLFTQVNWAPHFRPALEDEPNLLPVTELLKLEPSAREGKVAVIFSLGENGELQRWVASRQVVEAAQAAENQWHTLREIAGTLTPYPEKLWKEAEAELTKKYEAKLADVRADYESQLAEKETAVMADVKVKLREKLLALSKRGMVN
ncbi:MAG: 4Fe-4S binding protein [Lewinellaceae bacterium]|nr:4Fe-4S binding protein [Saprospiraceae bacterium]MCB9340598.1 4Fe-4S binding protein [Lewinellaceae bacterium]